MARNRKNSIYLDNKQFFIREGSYRREIAPTTIPKFSSGDLSYSDLTAWQYWAQSDWKGSTNKTYQINPNDNYYLRGIDTLLVPGTLRKWPILLDTADSLTQEHSDYISASGGTYAARASGTSAFFDKVSGATPIWFKKSFVYTTSSAVAGMGTTDGNNIYIALPQVNKIMKGPLSPSLLNVGFSIRSNPVYYKGKIYIMAGQNTNVFGLYAWNISTAALETVDIASFPSNYIPGYQYYDNARIELIGSKLYITLPLHSSGKIQVYVHDFNVTYFLTELNASIVHVTDDVLFRYTAVYNDELYIACWALGDSTGRRFFLYKITTSGQVIKAFEEEEDSLTSFSAKQFLYPTPWGVLVGAQNSFIFDGQNMLGGFRNNQGSSGSYIRALGVLFAGSKIFAQGSAGTQKFYVDYASKTYTTSATIDYLESSIIDFDLFNVDKYIGGLTIYHQPLAAGCTITLKVKIDNASSYTTVGSNSLLNSTSFDVQLLTGNIGKKIQYRIELDTTNSANTPIVEDIVIRYVLQPKVKRKWTMDLLIANNIEEYSSKRTALDLDKELWATLRRGVIKFKDVDGVQYDATKNGTDDKGVLISDCKMQGPFPFGEDGPEYVATLELIEG